MMGQTVEDDEELHQKRRAANEVNVDLGEQTQRRELGQLSQSR